MIYRVRDTIKNRWVNDNVYLSPDGELYIIKKSIFGRTKVALALPQDRYVYNKGIDLYDKNSVVIHEGDYVKAQVSEDRIVTGIVVYAAELSAYIMLCIDYDEYFTLGNEVCEFVEVIGNVFDGYNEVKESDEQSLRE